MKKKARSSEALVLKRVAGAVVVLCAALFLCRTAAFFRDHTLPLNDQGANLELALRVHEAGGWTGWITDCLSGSYMEANRHPLVPLLLHPWARREARFFDAARLLCGILAATGWTLFFLVLVRKDGIKTALAAAACLALIPDTARFAITVGPECLLPQFCGTAWLLLSVDDRRAAWAAGALLGLAYLLKGSALLFAVCCLAGAWLGKAPRKNLLRAGAGFLAAASPLILRNLIVYHDPFYNVSTRHVLWLDSWWEFWPLDWAGTLATIGPAHYFGGHSPLEALLRWLNGLLEVGGVVLQAWSPGGAVGAFLFLTAAGWGLARNGSLPLKSAALSVLAGFWAAFAWYAPIGVYSRFLYPLLPIAAVFAGKAVLDCSGRIPAKGRLAAAGIAICWLSALAAPSLRARDSVRPLNLNHPGVVEFVDWMRTHFKNETKVVMNTDDAFFWMLPSSPRKASLPIGPSRVWHFAQWGKADYVVFLGKSPGEPPPGLRLTFANELVRIYARGASKHPI